METRTPGYYERYFICRNTEKCYTNFNIIAKYNQRVSPQLLHRALQTFIEKTPILTVNFFRNKITSVEDDEAFQGLNFTARHVKQIKFEDVVTFEAIPAFDEKVFSHVNKLMCPVDVELPLWRVIVFEVTTDGSQYICAYFEHALFDGQSGAQFHRDLIDELEAASRCDVRYSHAEHVTNFIYDGCKRPLPPAAEHLSDLFDPSFWQKTVALAQVYIPKWVYKAIGESTAEDSVFKFKSSTRDLSAEYKQINFTPKELQRMLTFCKNNKIALTAFLEVLTKLAMEETFFKIIPPPAGHWRTSTLTAASGRRHLEAPQGGFRYGCLVTGYISEFEAVVPAETDLLDRMQTFHAALHASVATKLCFKRIGLYQYLNIWQMCKGNIGTMDRLTLQISNLGRFELSGKQTKWDVESLWFGGGTGFTYNFVLNLISSSLAGLNILLCMRPEYRILRDEQGEAVVDTFVSRLRHHVLHMSAV